MFSSINRAWSTIRIVKASHPLLSPELANIIPSPSHSPVYMLINLLAVLVLCTRILGWYWWSMLRAKQFVIYFDAVLLPAVQWPIAVKLYFHASAFVFLVVLFVGFWFVRMCLMKFRRLWKALGISATNEPLPTETFASLLNPLANLDRH